ncbi:MAG TPA: L-threonylcarbamoyladenylate synthase [Xanthomonadales bacterium]|nr:L-threonylcarbamoyladenylate synthase [Xanthomonadales bacterium]
MSELLELHPKNPQQRFVRMAVEVLLDHGVVVYPTDSCYALGCVMGAKDAMERIQRIRQTDKHHFFTLVCRDLSDISRFARVNNWQYRTLKASTPGPYTFVLQATREVPRRLMNEKRRTVGIRVPDHPVVQMLLDEVGVPLMSTTLLLPGDDLPMTDATEIHERIGHAVDLVLDGGNCGLEPTTVVDLSGDAPLVLRAGKGDPTPFQ